MECVWDCKGNPNSDGGRVSPVLCAFSAALSAHLFKLPNRVPHSPNRDVVVDGYPIPDVGMHGERILEVEKHGAHVEGVLHFRRHVGWEVDAQHLRFDATPRIPTTEYGRLIPLIALLGIG